MRFFIPRVDKTSSEVVYQDIKRSLIDQLRMPIGERRLFSLSYTNSKRNWHVEVGQVGQRERQYEVTAIFESGVFIVVNQTTDGAPGPIVLVDKTEVTALEEFSS